MTTQHTPGYRLRWRLDEKETGLRAVIAGPRGSTLRDANGTRYATVGAIKRGCDYLGWFWVAGWESSVPNQNTCNVPVETCEEAKKQALDYVRAAVAKATGDQP
jgi:hypothetical protein